MKKYIQYMDQLCIYYICILSKYSPLLSDIIGLIILMMLNSNRICCGPRCTTLITEDKVITIGREYPNDLISLSRSKIGDICFSPKGDIIYSSKINDMICVLNKTLRFGLCEPDYFIYESEEFKIPSVVSVHCGVYHQIVRTKNGECYGWGGNGNGQLGLGDRYGCGSPVKIPIENVTTVSCGYHYTAFLTKKNECFVCGQGEEGQLGLGDNGGLGQECDEVTLQKLNLPNIMLVVCSAFHTFALTTLGIYSWGCDNMFHAQLGLGPRKSPVGDNFCLPQKVNFENHSQIVSISLGKYHTMMLTASGELFGCGDGKKGQLGLGDLKVRSTFQKIRLGIYKPIKSVHCGRKHTVVTTSDSECHGWGSNEYGQLGFRGSDIQSKPISIKF